jgi:hypothetical protein
MKVKKVNIADTWKITVEKGSYPSYLVIVVVDDLVPT